LLLLILTINYRHRERSEVLGAFLGGLRECLG